jgi:hypothetical protein
MRYVHGGAQGGQFRLVGDAFGQRARRRGQQVGGRQLLAQPVHGDRARVVHRDQHRRARDTGGDTAQGHGDVGGGRLRWRRGMDLTDKTRPRDRTSGGVRDHMHLHSGPAERAHGAQRSVVKGISVDPQQYGGDAGVEQRHGLNSFGRFTRAGDRATRKPQARWRSSSAHD